jgi:hypothetical protein
MAEEFVQTDPEIGADTADERRVRVRHPQKLNTYAQRGAGDLDQVWWMGNVRNISGSGIGLIIQNRFEEGTLLTLELENASRTGSHTLQAEVVRVFPERGGWFLGCTFSRELTDTEIQELLQ